MRIRSAVLLLAALVSVPLAAQQAPARKGAAATVPTLTDAELIDVAKKVKSVRVEPATITIRVGQKVNLSSFTVTVLDSADTVRGRLNAFDFAVIPPGEPASVLPTGLTGERPGTTTLILRYPRGAWSKVRTGTRPEAKVSVIVTP